MAPVLVETTVLTDLLGGRTGARLRLERLPELDLEHWPAGE
jgi:hypothetical protein